MLENEKFWKRFEAKKFDPDRNYNFEVAEKIVFRIRNGLENRNTESRFEVQLWLVTGGDHITPVMVKSNTLKTFQALKEMTKS